MRRFKLLIISLSLFLLFAPAIPIVWFVGKGRNEPESKPKILLYPIGEFSSVSLVEWIDEELIIHTPTLLARHDPKNRVSKILAEHPEGEVAGYNGREVFFCQYSNSVIFSPDQFATSITILDSERKSIDTIELHQTVRPLNCSPTSILLTNNYHGAPEKYYQYEGGTRQLAEAKTPGSDVIISGQEETELMVGNQNIGLQMPNNFKAGYPSADAKQIALIDMSRNLWIVEIVSTAFEKSSYLVMPVSSDTDLIAQAKECQAVLTKYPSISHRLLLSYQ
ncbi:MAG: hypothetical protein QY318_03380 [Candidatus Dojkabacteria bacterium]|nr:MAG: hypothetical protein QY318_03380 [Candidatus Dojkabacteria bacterium]